jgi:3-vinyl bacteriochlorophyllide hydratase
MHPFDANNGESVPSLARRSVAASPLAELTRVTVALTPTFVNGGLISGLISRLDCCPWGAAAGRTAVRSARPLYTAEERRRRDASAWTMVQAVLAPLQFAVFLVSLALVLRYLATGNGWTAAAASVVVKTLVLYAIMITGALWERAVFGRYLFARSFFWEDLFSILVLALHTAYLAALALGGLSGAQLMLLALAAYAAYAINATQFVLKLRAARREHRSWPGGVVRAVGVPE